MSLEPNALALNAFARPEFADRIAVDCDGSTLSYAELDAMSLAMAERLQVAAGDCVGLCVARGLHLPTALLAILRAGASYVPLDPSFPSSRLQYMASNSACQLIVGEAAAADKFSALGIRFVAIEELLAAIEGSAGAGADSAAQRGFENMQLPAYVIYTSGSTGQPKGVELSRAALDNLVSWQGTREGFTTAGKTLQYTPVGFDVHFQEFFVTWQAGGTLVMIDDALRRDPLSLLRFIVDQSITHLYLPFVALQQLAEIAVTYGPIPESLQQVVTAGEQLKVNRFISGLFERLPKAVLHNHYGPSETHVVTSYTLEGPANEWPSLPAIGRPIANVEAYVLDEHGQLQKPANGASGELVIAGPCLANGYKNRPDLTAERFAQLSIDGREQRCYRTGDLVEWQSTDKPGAELVLQYLGRADGQVKIRGYRVETGEIETALDDHAAVKESAVVALSNDLGEQSLVAYVVPSGDTSYAESATATAETQQIEQWQSVWDGTYTDTDANGEAAIEALPQNPALDFCGWNSSYTGEALPEVEMTTWVEQTVARIQALKPERVLELGCGTGLILHNVAADCQRYVGTDFSAVALARLKRTIDQRGAALAHVELQQCAAHELDAFSAGEFDCIVMNSVTQHLPSASYLEDVVTKAMALLAEGGSLFIGDVTNRLTREAFFASVALHGARSDESSAQLREAVQRRLGSEMELVIEPAFFAGLARQSDAIGNVQVLLKRGNYRNELGDFRYDVILQKGASDSAPKAQHWQPWSEFAAADSSEQAATQRLAAQLANPAKSTLALSDVPNRRLWRYARTLTEVNDPAEQTKAELLALLEREQRASAEAHGLDPDEIWRLADEAGYHAVLSWHSKAFHFDLCLVPAEGAAGMPSMRPMPQDKPLAACTSTPLGNYVEALVPELRGKLEESLPDYMIPARFIVLSQFPVTPTGKLDRRALPRPSTARPATSQDYVAPQTELQQGLARIWSEVLEIDQVGLLDNFFELGGNSLTSLRVAMKVRDELERDLPVAYFFQHPSLQSLAEYLETDEQAVAERIKSTSEDRASKAKAAFARGRNMKKRMNRV